VKKSVMFGLLISGACAVALRIAYEALDVSQGVDLAQSCSDSLLVDTRRRLTEIEKRIAALEKARKK